MVVGQHHEGRPRRRLPHRLLGQRRQHPLDPGRRHRELLLPPVDQHRAAPAGAPAPPPAPGPTWPAPRIMDRGQRRPLRRGLRAAAARASRPRRAPPSARVRPPQHWPISGPSGTSSDCRTPPRASSARAASIAIYSSCPPPMVPSVRFADDQHPGAGLARRRALRALAPAPASPAPGRGSASTASGRTSIISAPAQAVHRHQHPLRRRRRVEPRALPVVRRRSPPPSTAPRAPRPPA